MEFYLASPSGGTCVDVRPPAWGGGLMQLSRLIGKWHVMGGVCVCWVGNNRNFHNFHKKLAEMTLVVGAAARWQWRFHPKFRQKLGIFRGNLSDWVGWWNWINWIFLNLKKLNFVANFRVFAVWADRWLWRLFQNIAKNIKFLVDFVECGRWMKLN